MRSTSELLLLLLEGSAKKQHIIDFISWILHSTIIYHNDTSHQQRLANQRLAWRSVHHASPNAAMELNLNILPATNPCASEMKAKRANCFHCPRTGDAKKKKEEEERNRRRAPAKYRFVVRGLFIIIFSFPPTDHPPQQREISRGPHNAAKRVRAACECDGSGLLYFNLWGKKACSLHDSKATTTITRSRAKFA